MRMKTAGPSGKAINLRASSCAMGRACALASVVAGTASSRSMTTASGAERGSLAIKSALLAGANKTLR